MQNIAHKIINLGNTDYHMHTSSFSDWISTWDELVKFAWEVWLTEIAITDHSQVCLEKFRSNHSMYVWATARRSLRTWQNVYNDVKVIIWVEADILDELWNCCFDIQWKEWDFIVLSAHSDVYSWSPETVTQGTIKAIEQFHDKINCIWHPCNNADFGRRYDMDKLIEVANYHMIPLECNAKNLMKWKTNLDKLHMLLQKADKIYLNSDAHNAYELKEARKFAKQLLIDRWYLSVEEIDL
jgi:histidinol phosphatase-like PHP family hydrolase